MRPKSLLLLALALGCGLIASIGISQVMEGKKQGPTGVEKEAIYIAKVNINTGDPIDSEMVMLKEWPTGDIPSGAIRELGELEDRRPRTPLFQGEPILENKLLNPGERDADPTQQIPKGFRIVPISVRADTGAAGLLRPGDRVDVQWYVAKNPQVGVLETTTKTILHNVRVFAIDQTVTRPMSGDEAPALAKTISLLLDPEQANKVQLATKIGEVSLIPRHPDDPSSPDAAAVSFDDLFNESDKNSRAEEQGLPQTVQAAPEGLLSGWGKMWDRLASNANRPTPPFEMELVLGDQIHHELFDPLSGKPLRDGVRAGTRVPRSSSGAGSGPASESELEADEIPISIEALDGDAPEGAETLKELLHDTDLTDVPAEFPIDFGSTGR